MTRCQIGTRIDLLERVIVLRSRGHKTPFVREIADGAKNLMKDVEEIKLKPKPSVSIQFR